MKNKSFNEPPDNTGKSGKLKMYDKTIRHYKIIDEIRSLQEDNPQKANYFQLIRFKNGKKELRLCYYIIGKVGRAEGKWVFGRFATVLPAKEFKVLIEEAQKRSWF